MEIFRERRRRLLERLEGTAVFAATPVAIRNNDVEHEYRQDSDLYYLTGFDEPEAVLVLTKVHDEHRSVLFLRPRDREREVWDGSRLGVEDAPARLGVDAAFAVGELRAKLPGYLTGARELCFDIGRNPKLDETVLASITQARGRGRTPKPWPRRIVHPETLLHEQRLVKGVEELAVMRRAAAITAEAHVGAMRLARPGRYEYELEAQLRQVFRRAGAERPAYSPIVGSGPNATVLHYVKNHRRIEDGDLVLIDAGCELEYYASDVTRTFPANGRFTPAQRRFYQAVLDAQLAVLAAVRPGATIEALHEISVRTICQGLLDLGLCHGQLDEVVGKELYKRYYMHRTSHWLGLDVHDVGSYFEGGSARPLEPGMVFTVEPGIYVAADDAEAPTEYRGLGVRIEDDILVTAEGYENLTAAIPKTVEEIEHACQG
ncbi:MAG: Xaa-Pro aminopeptidase [Polyangiaceae bacterium]|nr:Xaa-Pro aminopeptidase [Polyangiaceae bacterium]